MDISRRAFGFSLLALAACRGSTAAAPGSTGDAPTAPGVPGLDPDPATITPVTLPDAEWQAKLDPQAYRVLRHEGTEMAFSGRYWNNHADGVYTCAGCGLNLYAAADKFESGTGWPSYTRPIKPGRVTEKSDRTLGMLRTEVRCARCDGHLGHVFDDGPPPTGMRHCINSAALLFVPAKA